MCRKEAADEPPVWPQHLDNTGKPRQRARQREGSQTELSHPRALPHNHRGIASRETAKDAKGRAVEENPGHEADRDRDGDNREREADLRTDPIGWSDWTARHHLTCS